MTPRSQVAAQRRPRPWRLGVGGLLATCLLMASCSLLQDPGGPGVPTGPAGPKRPDARPGSGPASAGRPAASSVCNISEAIAQLAQLQSLSLDEQRREHLQAQQAFQAEATEANRFRVVLTLSLMRFAWRDDVRVLRLIEAADGPLTEGGCSAELGPILLRQVSDRLRLLREEQRRHEVQLREEQRNHELLLREELRRYDTVIREEKERNAEFKRKLDALIDIDRRLRRDSQGAKK